VFQILQSCNPHAGPLLPRVKHLDIPLKEFDNGAPYPNLVIGNALESICVTFCGYSDNQSVETSLSDSLWNDMSSLLFSSATVVKSFRVDAKCVFVNGNTLVDFGVQDRLLNVYRSFRRLEVFDARSLTLT
jgi:hypothetical protein